MSKVIMAWSKCKIEIGKTGDADAFATSLASIGTIQDKSSTLSAEDGDELTATATGGEEVANEVLEGTLTLETSVIEPTNAFLQSLGLANADGRVTTHVVDGDWSVKVTPKNKGAIGIKAPKCNIKYAPAWDEENGNVGKLTIKILKTTDVAEGDNYWYDRFTTDSAL